MKLSGLLSTHRRSHLVFEVTDDDGWIPVGADARDDLTVDLPFPAVVRGRDASNQEFEEESTIRSLSPRRVSITLTRPMVAGADLLIVVRLSLARDDRTPVLHLALEGVITITEWLGESRWRVEMQLKCHRFIYASDKDPSGSERGDG